MVEQSGAQQVQIEVPYYIKGTFVQKSKRSPFILDTEGGLVHFFKQQGETKPYQSLALTGAELTPHEDVVFNKETGTTRKCFTVQFKQRDGKNKGSPMQVTCDEEEETAFLLMKCAFEVATGFVRATDDQRSASIANVEEILQTRKPNALQKVVITINSTPEILTLSKRTERKTKNPQNALSGLGYGGFALVKGVAEGVAGIVTEPVKGGISSGPKGVAKGIGRGLIGIVAKPIGGVAGFLQCTVQGVANTPGTIARAIKKGDTSIIDQLPVERRSMIQQMFTERKEEFRKFKEDQDAIRQNINQLEIQQESNDPQFVQNVVQLMEKTSMPDYIFKTQLLNEIWEEMVELNPSEDDSAFLDCDVTFEEVPIEQGTEAEKSSEDQDSKMQAQTTILELARNFKAIQRSDDWRQPDGYKSGGFPLVDPEVVARYRTAAKDMIAQIGKKIFSGSFNLSTVSFPIYCMSPESLLYMIATMSIHSPTYLNAAALTTDPVRRMKFVITTSLSFLYSCHRFDKPLNPILGETYQGQHDDGTKIYMEQVSHHPPVSYMLQVGPNNLYRWWGYSAYTPKAHLNSIELNVTGGKWIEFNDGTIISYQPHQDKILNSLWGTLVHLICGRITFEDKKNGLIAWYEIGHEKKKPADYFYGEIYKNGTLVSKLNGNQFGYIDFDNERFWDVRDQVNYRVQDVETDGELLGSDCKLRQDTIEHKRNNMVEAQQNKDKAENLQRADRKIRNAAIKRRQEGGKKIDYSKYPDHPLCSAR